MEEEIAQMEKDKEEKKVRIKRTDKEAMRRVSQCKFRQVRLGSRCWMLSTDHTLRDTMIPCWPHVSSFSTLPCRIVAGTTTLCRFRCFVF
jgi:hypothetical protein